MKSSADRREPAKSEKLPVGQENIAILRDITARAEAEQQCQVPSPKRAENIPRKSGK